jgi:dolichyl-phosphate beta-glucosyltransferase
MTLQLTIVVPAFDEAHRLAEGMRRLDAAAAAGAVDVDRTEVVVVDDGSTDDTAAVAEKLLAALPHHRVLRLPRNRGKGAAVRTGMAASRTPYTAYMDADMAIDPLAVPLLLDGLAAGDIAIGSRALHDSRVETRYVVRSLMGRLFNELVTAGTGLGLNDTQCGFKAFRTPAARLLFHLVRIDRFAFDVEILARARRLGLDVTEVPVHWRHVEGSTVHPIHDSWSMLADVARSRRGRLAGPPVPSVTVRAGGAVATDDVDDLHRRVAMQLVPVLDGAPVPAVRHASGVTVLFPLVDPAVVAGAASALRDGLAGATVTRRDLGLEDLAGFGPLGGRLVAAIPSEPPD